MSTKSFTLALLFTLSCSVLTLAAETWSYPSSYSSEDVGGGGSGTKDNPYKIYTAQQLANFARYVNDKGWGNAYKGKYVSLEADIVLNDNVIVNGVVNTSSQEWTPIGEYGSLYNDSFEGIFNGNGHTISGVYVNTERDYNGLFGDVKHGAIRNLHVKDSYIAKGKSRAGGIVAHVHGGDYDMAIENCSFDGIIVGHSSKETSLGGVVGYIDNSWNVYNCQASGQIIDSSGKAINIGGICGMGSSATFTECRNEMSITSASANSYIGGMAGKAHKVKLCGNLANIQVTGNPSSVTNLNIGGVCGEVSSSIEQSFNYGQISSSYNAIYAGVVGRLNNASINNCFNVGNVQHDTNRTGYAIYAKQSSNTTYDEVALNLVWLEGTATYGTPYNNTDMAYTEELIIDDTAVGTFQGYERKNLIAIMENCTNIAWGSHASLSYPFPRKWGAVITYFHLKDNNLLGTQENPYTISSVKDFEAMQRRLYTQNDSCWGEYFVQTTDLDFSANSTIRTSGVKYEMIELSGTVIDLSYYIPFCATYEGNNKVIKGYAISTTSNCGAAIFGENKGAIKNLIIDNFSNIENSPEPSNSAAVAVVNKGTITNIIVKNSEITSQRAAAGGIAGSNYGTINRTSVFNTIIKGMNIGGIVGVSMNGVVSNTTSAATLDARGFDRTIGQRPHIGGIAGESYGATVDNSYFIADVDKILFEYTDGNDCPYIGGNVGYGIDSNYAISTTSFVVPWEDNYPNVVQQRGYFGSIVGTLSNYQNQYNIYKLILDRMGSSIDWYGCGSTSLASIKHGYISFRWNINSSNGTATFNNLGRSSKYFYSDSIVQGYYMPLPKNAPTTYQVESSAQYISAVVNEKDLIKGSITYLDITATKAMDNTIFHPLTQVIDEFYDLPNVRNSDNLVRNWVLVDEKDYTFDEELTAQNIYYKREKAMNWNAMCLPFAVTQSMLPENSIMEIITNISDGKVHTDKVTEVAAGVPFLLYCEDAEFVIDIKNCNENISYSPSNNNEIPYIGVFQNTTISASTFVLDNDGDRFIKVENDTVPAFQAYIDAALWESLTELEIIHDQVYYNENIYCNTHYYLDPEYWRTEDANEWYAACFINLNDNTETWIKGTPKTNDTLRVDFYLPSLTRTEKAYTHIVFCRMGSESEEMSIENALNNTIKLVYKEPENSKNLMVYHTTGTDEEEGEWVEVDPSIPSSVNDCLTENHIIYTNYTVYANGKIMVYNINGTLILQGYDSVDMSGLPQGLYIVRNNNIVEKIIR